MTANIRMMAENVADLGSVSANSTSGSLVASNLLLEPKSLVWRSTGTSATLSVTLDKARTINMIALAFTNLSATATIAISGATQANSLAIPADLGKPLDWGSNPGSANSFSYGGGNLARVFFNSMLTSSFTITITDTSNADGYIEAARLLVGQYYEFSHNPDPGFGMGVIDSSTQKRSAAGDLLVDRSYRARLLTLQLNTMNDADRAQLLTVMRRNGLSKGVFLSIFPLSTNGQLEADTQIYGKFTQLNNATMQFINLYGGQIDIAE